MMISIAAGLFFAAGLCVGYVLAQGRVVQPDDAYGIAVTTNEDAARSVS